MAQTLGGKLEIARKNLGLSITDIAEQLHLSDEVIGKIEKNAFANQKIDVYIRGYLYNYARAVKLPEKEVDTALAGWKSQRSSPLVSAPVPSVTPATVKPSQKQSAGNSFGLKQVMRFIGRRFRWLGYCFSWLRFIKKVHYPVRWMSYSLIFLLVLLVITFHYTHRDLSVKALAQAERPNDSAVPSLASVGNAPVVPTMAPDISSMTPLSVQANASLPEPGQKSS